MFVRVGKEIAEFGFCDGNSDGNGWMVGNEGTDIMIEMGFFLSMD